MRILLNILWVIFGGFISWGLWILTGCFYCITIIGIPVGMQCFKLAGISLDPFGKEIRYGDNGAFSFLLNVIWMIFGGFEMAVTNLAIGCVLCLSIIGIPWGMQYFKIAKLALMPFGAGVERVKVL